jgi:hypothetical protein
MSERRMWPTPQAWNERGSRAAYVAAGKGGMDLVTAVQLPDAPTASSQLTLFAEAFPASPTPWLADVKDLQTSATSGPSSSDSFASLDPDGSWRKTCQGYSQVTLDGSLARFSETWPRAGMTRNGTAYRRLPSAPLTGEIASGLLPIPTATTQDHFSARVTANRKKEWTSHPGVTLLDYARMWPTPGVTDSIEVQMPEAAIRKRWESQKDRPRGAPAKLSTQVLVRLPTPTAVTDTGGAAMCKWGGSGARERPREMFTETELNGALNPTWVEWLMGYPLGWTVCEGWGTASSRRSRNGSRGASRKRKG